MDFEKGTLTCKCGDCEFSGDITEFPTTTYYYEHEEGTDKDRVNYCPKCESEDITYYDNASVKFDEFFE